MVHQRRRHSAARGTPPKSARPGLGPATGGETIAVVGHGMVAWKLCQALVARGGHRSRTIVVLGEERRPAYDRVHLARLLAGASAEALELSQPSWYAEHAIELHLGDAVMNIDRDRRTLRTAAGRLVKWDRLVLATGSRANVPKIPGVERPGVFVHRTEDDLCAIRAHLETSKHAVVIGGGILGLEVAKVIRDLGRTVEVVHGGPWLMNRQLDERAGALLLEKLEALNIRARSGARVERIVGGTAEGRASLRVDLAGGEGIDTDLVILSVGTTPRSELALAAGLELSKDGGVIVDDGLRTSDPTIYAIGECAAHHGEAHGFVAPGNRMAEVLADNLLGGEVLFEGTTPLARLKGFDFPVVTVGLGEPPATGEARIFSANGSYRKLVIDGGRLVGALAVGAWPAFEEVRVAVLERRTLSTEELDLFTRTGDLWPEGQLDVTAWAPETIVCACERVPKGRLALAIEEGCGTVDALARCTRASTQCGSCRPLLEALLTPLDAEVDANHVNEPVMEAPATEPEPSTSTPRPPTPKPARRPSTRPGSRAAPEKGHRALGVAAVAAALLIVGTLFVGPGSAPTSAHDLSPWTLLSTDPFWRQVSGWTALGLAAVSLVLSARKRIAKLRTTELGPWRAVHAVLGVGMLAALIAHTGLRLGEHLNRALMAEVLALAVLGVVAAMVTALASKMRPDHARDRRRTTAFVHLALFWPLPVLTLLHVVSTFYY